MLLLRSTFCSLLLLGLVFSSHSLEGLAVSVRASGMGSTGIAYPQDALASAYNPAGIVNVCDRFDIGIYGKCYEGDARISGNLNTKNELNPNTNGSFDSFRRKRFYSGDFGINKNFCLCDIPFSISFVAYEKNFFHPNYNVIFPRFGTTRAEMEFIHYVFAPALAFKIWDHSFGFSINVNQCHFKANGFEKLLFFSSDPTNISNQGGQTEYGVGVTVGWQWDILDCLSVGLTYQPKTRVQAFDKYQGLLAEKGLIDTPQCIAGGIAWKFIPEATLAFDVEHQLWNQIRSLGNNFNPAFDEAVGFPRPTPPSVSHRLGRKDGPGFGWRNVTFFRVGLDYAINPAWTVRAGFRHSNALIPQSNTAFNLFTMDTIQNVASIGLTFGFNECNEISGFYAHGFGDNVIGSKDSIPRSLGGGRTDLQSSLNTFGFSYGRWF